MKEIAQKDLPSSEKDLGKAGKYQAQTAAIPMTTQPDRS